MEKIMIVDDDEEIRRQLKWGLGSGYAVFQAGSRAEALSLLEKHKPKVVTLDLGLPPHADGVEEGFAVLSAITRESPFTKVIVITGNGERENALKAIQAGAYDYYEKPVDLQELKVIINRALHLHRIEQENQKLQRGLNVAGTESFGIAGQCEAIQRVFSTIRKIGSSDVSVLIMGESGTGKELVAKAIHAMSLRKDGPFVSVNCGAIPENLLESEFFGYEKGAFTGAQAQTQGKVEYASKGTLFLDEIGELPTNLQVKLLRFLQERTMQRIGGREDIHVDARILAATNIDMAKSISDGSFREDLYYRIGVITITLPPLREREDDILLLTNLFLMRFAEMFKKRIKGLSAQAREFVESYNWPGNVRELENRLQRAVIMAESPLLEINDLGFADGEKLAAATQSWNGMTLKEAKNSIEQHIIASAIGKFRGNIAKTAVELGVSRPTLYDLMKKHGINNSSAEGYEKKTTSLKGEINGID
ncbi:MAG: PEP-CTERM-box response regulator transcription factor [Nitrospiraceae bacterium]|nr:PEP-CTERM-box response regulator transcription factor [Nitrospiraceae bacterium]